MASINQNNNLVLDYFLYKLEDNKSFSVSTSGIIFKWTLMILKETLKREL